MLSNYLSTALRNALRNRGYTLINVIGLATGLAAVLLISLYVRSELSFDRLHANSERIARIEMDMGEGDSWASTLMPVGPEMQRRLPEVEAHVRLSNLGEQVVQTDHISRYENRFLFAEPSFFEVFDGFSITAGDYRELSRPGTVMLSQSTSARYFGDEDPVGQTLTTGVRNSDHERLFDIVGVYEDMPGNVHLQADFLASFSTRGSESRGREWQMLASTYVLLRSASDTNALEAKLTSFAETAITPNVPQAVGLIVRPLERIHLYPASSGEIQPQGDIRYVWIFSTIAALILLIACINYLNLATARSAHRAREVGVRKSVGARRGQLAAQFMSESVTLTAGSLLLALAMSQLALPYFNWMLDRPPVQNLGSLELIVYLLVLGAIVSLVSGAYPAMQLSRYSPALALKGRAGLKSGGALRKGLVVFQFMVSMTLIVSTIVIHRQLHFVQNARLGFDPDQLLVLPTQDDFAQDASAFKQAVGRLPSVQRVAFGSSVPGRPGALLFFNAEDVEQYDGDMLVADYHWIDADYIETLGLELVEGRSFRADGSSDVGRALMINETTVARLGWQEPVGKLIRRNDKDMEIIGVFADYHNRSFRSDVQPSFFELHPEIPTTYLAVRLSSTDIVASLDQIEQIWDTFIPGRPMNYFFLDDEFDAMYRSEERLARLFSSFSVLAILVAALGLFGLAAYTAQQRTKEIGIRKVLGASISGLILMLSKDFVRLVLVAFVIAAPIAYFAMDDWLSAFAYRIEIGPGIFLFAAGLAGVITLATVSWQAVRAALANPVDSLRTE